MTRNRRYLVWLLAMLGLFWASLGYAADNKRRIFIVSSYHREYLWSQATQQGLAAAMLRYAYLDNTMQSQELAQHDAVESSKAVIKKVWMDTKRKHSDAEIAQATARIVRAIEAFRPDLVLLGDDNAAHYIGHQLLDTDIPVVFWGINGLPLKYGLVDSLERPGHNITGVWQSGYLKESLELLRALVPGAKTFAIIACDSETARPKVKQLQALAREGQLPLQLVDTIVTNSFTTFKQRALSAAQKVDAFFVLNHDTLKDDQGQHVDMLAVGKWYMETINKPEASHEGQFVKEGMLCTANDSGYNQGYEAFRMAVEILEDGANPATMPPRTPPRGPLMVNRVRAKMLGISLDQKMDLIEDVVDNAIALQESTAK